MVGAGVTGQKSSVDDYKRRLVGFNSGTVDLRLVIYTILY